MVYTQLNVLERQLVMTPLARAAAGVTIEPAGVRGIPDDSRRAGTGSKGGRGKLTPQVRAELRKLRRDDPLGGVPDEEEEAIEGNPSIADGAAS